MILAILYVGIAAFLTEFERPLWVKEDVDFRFALMHHIAAQRRLWHCSTTYAPRKKRDFLPSAVFAANVISTDVTITAT